MSAAGKPLRFLGWVLGGWAVLRIGVVATPLLLPEQEEGVSKIRSRRPSVAARADISAAEAPVRRCPVRDDIVLSRKRPLRSDRPVSPRTAPARSPPLSREAVALQTWSSVSREPPPAAAVQTGLPQQTGSALSIPSVPAQHVSRWSLSGWLLWRRAADPSLAQGPLLGGSQGGIRLDYRLWSKGSRSFGLYGRLTRALERPVAEEAAVGLALRPVEGLPVSLMAERRQKLGDGGRSAFAFLAAGGIGPKAIAPRLEVEGYAQAGVVAARDAAGFVDGKLAIDYRLTRRSIPDLALGLGLSGSAQPGAARLDVGPELRLRLPVANGHVRLSAEWRQRIAGTARPASGPAIALVADF